VTALSSLSIRKKCRPPDRKGLGFRYLTFQITNIDEICSDCERAGITFELEKQELMPGVTIAMVLDPDGNVVEFVQRD
jgi:catechol 2,3-dioxygenase-like lactoylglutathione lyase family enzyme